MPSMNVGYPDGDNRPTVTMDYRRTYTFKPNVQGDLSFGIGTGFYGCLIKGRGTMDMVPVNTAHMSSSGAIVAEGGSATYANDATGLIPILAPVAAQGSTFPAYRPLVAVAEVVYTGSTMENGGAVIIAKTSSANALSGTVANRGLYTAQLVDPAITATSVVGAARDSYTSRVVPADPEFQAAQDAAINQQADSAVMITNGLISTVSTTGAQKLCSFPCAQAGAVWYSYSGLHSSASVTVSVRYCVQYSVDGSSAMIPLAKPSPPPPETPGVLSRVFSAVTSSPAALTFAANALGHALPATRPFLAIAADAYNHA